MQRCLPEKAEENQIPELEKEISRKFQCQQNSTLFQVLQGQLLDEENRKKDRPRLCNYQYSYYLKRDDLSTKEIALTL
jgi:hypothetical protein